MIKVFMVIFLSSACAQVKIHSKGKLPVSFKKEKDHTRPIHVEVKREYFLWGILPDDYEINVDQVMREKGITSLAQLTIKEEPETSDKWWTFLSFGVYQPKRYVIEGKTIIKE